MRNRLRTQHKQSPWGGKETDRSEEQKGERRECWEAGALTEPREERRLSGGLPQPVHQALHSRVLYQLLQVLDLAAQLISWWEALAHLHEESCDLVAAQEASRPPPQPMQDAGLHSRCRDNGQQALPQHPAQSHRHLGEWGEGV